LKEQSFKEISNFDGTVLQVGGGPRYTTISDLLYILLLNVADENPDKLETYLPQAIAHLLENGKPSRYLNSKFWSRENYTNGVARFS